MPTTRRSTGGTRARPGPGKGQSTISFANKVTKVTPKDDKKAVLADPTDKAIDVVAPPPPAEKEPEEAPAEAEQEEEEEEEEEEEAAIAEVPKNEAELRAAKITDAQVGRYWKKIEAERTAPRVHQEELSVSEKVLRYFDVSSQYGPCIGVQRLKRWERAERLGLNPPIEVLAVLLKEEGKGNDNIERAHMDEILNSTTVGA